MRELVVISGKGGTGKTSLTAAFAALADNSVLCDADVDAADLHLLLAPEIKHRHAFKGGCVARIVTDKCTQCGLCLELCRFNAIGKDFIVNPLDCEGCGVCVDLCPEHAVLFPEKTCGEWYISFTRFGPMVHARLGVAEENSGKLVTLIRGEAKKLAQQERLDLIITDGPPGIGCPVIASIGGASALLIVSEPTVSGLHDMQRVARLADHFKVPALLCVNKFDLNLDQTVLIEETARQMNIRVLNRLPFDPVFVTSMIQGHTVIDHDASSPVCGTIKHIWHDIINSEALNTGNEKSTTILNTVTIK